MNALDELLHRIGAIVPLVELRRACGDGLTERLLASGQVLPVAGSYVTASPSLRDPRLGTGGQESTRLTRL